MASLWTGPTPLGHVTGLPTASTSVSLLVKAWLEGSERDEEPFRNTGSCTPTSSFLGSPHLRPAFETTWGSWGGCSGKVTSLALEGLALSFAGWPGAHPLPSLSSVYLRIPQGLPLLRHFVFEEPNFGDCHV